MTHVLTGLLCGIVGILSTHNFYVSTTSIRFVPQDKILQITVQVFLDDFEAALQQDQNETIKLNSKLPQDDIDRITEDYFRENLLFMEHNDTLNFSFLGKVYKNDVVVVYMEMKLDSNPQQFSIKNTILFDLLSDQKNIIHLKLGSKRKSFLAVTSKSEFQIPEDFFNFQN
ncbi:MAG: DUF6702 family protein [Flavobacteriaceae bacterium]|jgi:hypothetical protein